MSNHLYFSDVKTPSAQNCIFSSPCKCDSPWAHMDRNSRDIRQKSEIRQIMHMWDLTKYMAWITFNRQPEHSNICLIKKNRYLTQEQDDNYNNHTQTKYSEERCAGSKGKNCRLATAVFAQAFVKRGKTGTVKPMEILGTTVFLRLSQLTLGACKFS